METSKSSSFWRVFMGLRPTRGDENRAESLVYDIPGAERSRPLFALDELRPLESLARNVRLNP